MGAVLDRVLTDPAITELTVVVAWAKYRGLRRLRDALLMFKERGRSRIIVGIDHGGGTAPGLRAALDWFSEAYVYHEAVPTTFHPKLLLAEGEMTAVLVVGSNNATAGGLWFNHEAALEAGFSKPAEDDHVALEGARRYVERLLEDDEVCLPLTEGRIDELVRSKRFRVSGHERHRPPSPQSSAVPGAGDEDFDPDGISEAEHSGPPIFGVSRHQKAAIPALPPGTAEELAELEDVGLEEEEAAATPEPASTGARPSPSAPTSGSSVGTTGTSPGAAAPSTPPAGAVTSSGSASTSAPSGGGAPTVVAWWDKKLPAGDAQQQPNPNTNPTGNLRLTQAKHPIDWRTWFRNVFFAGAAWVADSDSNGNAIERTTVPMDVTIFGISMGTMHFDVTHAKHRESGQANHTTVLHWGQLMPTLQATDYTGDTVTLSRLSDGTYRLDIS